MKKDWEDNTDDIRLGNYCSDFNTCVAPCYNTVSLIWRWSMDDS